jgi:hypothetical protein
MSEPGPSKVTAAQAEIAALAGAIERAAADLAITEEPSNFEVALESGTPRD